MLIEIVFILLLLVLAVWLFGFVHANDFSVQTKYAKDISKTYTNVLIIFPHADDEVLSTAGVITELAQRGVKLHWLILTQGEKGNEHASIDQQLKKIRVEEAVRAFGIYKMTDLIQRNYPDNGVTEHRDQLCKELKQTIESIQPDLIITYDLAGLYGHPDHIVTSEVVTDLVKHYFPDTKLWYVSHPLKILNSIQLPEHMAKDKLFKAKRSYPSFKVLIGPWGIINKIRALYVYESQRQSFLKSFPTRWIPLWFSVSVMTYEYYHEAH